MMENQWVEIRRCLTFFYVEELRELAARLSISDQGNKMALITRIVYFLQTGKEQKALAMPSQSRARRGQICPLAPEALMLKGAYKNDLKNRLFLKRIIGSHFHFTAFGIDWLNQRWMEGSPPTYAEFARMWQEEYERRKRVVVPPKEEWAYINFVQTFLLGIPHASKEEVNRAWEDERQINKRIVEQFLQKREMNAT